jgi:hypothetical protein
MLEMAGRVVDHAGAAESERRGNVGESRHRKRSAQPAKKPGLTDLHRQSGHKIGDGCNPGPNSLHAAAQPADRARQCHLRAADQIGSKFHASGRQRHRDAVVDRIKQAGQPGGKKVREQTECPMPLGAIPPRNAKPHRQCARITAVTRKRASALRM